MKTILALDYGQARIGLAINRGPIALPAGKIDCKGLSLSKRIEAIIQLAQEKKVQLILIGVPNRLNNQMSQQTQVCLDFIEALKKSLDSSIEIHTIDERLSSQQAHCLLKEGGHNRKKRHAHIDETSAWILLDTYLNQQNH